MAKFFGKIRKIYIDGHEDADFIQDKVLPWLLSGNTIKVDTKTVFKLINYLNFYGINTLMIQQDGRDEDAYYCKVCEATVKAYLQEREETKCLVSKPLEAPIFS